MGGLFEVVDQKKGAGEEGVGAGVKGDGVGGDLGEEVGGKMGLA